MTDGRTRQLTLTPTEAEKFKALAVGESMWIVRPACYDLRCPTCGGSASLPLGMTCADHRPQMTPPVGFVQACAPCGRCGGKRGWISLGPMEWADCGICAIELVEPCAECGGRGWTVEGQCWPQPEGEQVQCSCDERPVTLGYAYAVGEPLPIADLSLGADWPQGDWLQHTKGGIRRWRWNGSGHTFDLRGVPESGEVGQWAIEVRKA